MSADGVTLSIRFSAADFAEFQVEAEELRLPVSTYVRMLVFEGRRRPQEQEVVVRSLLAALATDVPLRLELRRLINNPLEG